MKTTILTVAVAAASASLASAGTCPGSSAFVHASCEFGVSFKNSCADVLDEMQLRVNGTNGWYDPHNRGTYTILDGPSKDGSNSVINLQRVTGNKMYTDKMRFTLTESDGSCSVDACSESQVTSVYDASTNFCNLRDLFCNKAGGCKIVKNDLSYNADFAFKSCRMHDTSSCNAVRRLRGEEEQ